MKKKSLVGSTPGELYRNNNYKKRTCSAWELLSGTLLVQFGPTVKSTKTAKSEICSDEDNEADSTSQIRSAISLNSPTTINVR